MNAVASFGAVRNTHMEESVCAVEVGKMSDEGETKVGKESYDEVIVMVWKG